MTNSLVREIVKIAIGVGILGAIMAIIILIAWGIHAPMLLGTLLGCAYAVLNFALTAVGIAKSMDKGESGARLSMMGSYYMRLILTAAMIIWAIKAPYFNVYTAAIPLVFPRLVITVDAALYKSKKSGGEEA